MRPVGSVCMYSVYTVGPTFNLSLRIIQLFTLIGRFELCSRVQNNITIFQSEPMVEKITKRTFAFTLTWKYGVYFRLRTSHLYLCRMKFFCLFNFNINFILSSGSNILIYIYICLSHCNGITKEISQISLIFTIFKFEESKY